ncbi:unnamed protein product [marine sediment metagenome]|uniref:Uncharacterized protein n=1 Tax=marine sediment metagenome TaxID=412755 RepID=X1RHK2_9ZZZZ
MNGRDYTIKFNALEGGVLNGLIMQSDDRSQLLLKPVLDQLIDIKKQIELDAGVKKEVILGGLLKITDRDGIVIIREPFPWEVGGN